MHPMTEEQIERRCERMMDHLDRLLLAGEMSREVYSESIIDLNAWADAQYAKLKRSAAIETLGVW